MFAPVKGNYSEEFKSLVMEMLQRDPDSRPSAADLCQLRLPAVSDSLACLLSTFLLPVTQSEQILMAQ